MVIGHELYHKHGKIIKVISSLLIAKNLYMHFLYEHTYGHHKKVGLPEDATFVPKGISLFDFAPRSYLRVISHVYEMQRD